MYNDVRGAWERENPQGLYKNGFGRENILELFRFIDGLMVLPEVLENQFEETLQQFEQEEKMPYITHIERKATARRSFYPETPASSSFWRTSPCY